MHRIPTPQDAPLPDADATGYTPTQHEHGQHAPGPTVYALADEDGHPVSPVRYATMTAAHMAALMSPPTHPYRVIPTTGEPTA